MLLPVTSSLAESNLHLASARNNSTPLALTPSPPPPFPRSRPQERPSAAAPPRCRPVGGPPRPAPISRLMPVAGWLPAKNSS